jgi:3-oxoacyl-[acyl-carrier protein] reductase
MRFKDKIVLVTGGSRGIGKAVVESFSREGATVIFTYKSSQKAAEQLTSDLRAAGAHIESYQHDAADTEGAQRLVEHVVNKYGGIDILINNAGITRDQLLMRMSETDWNAVIENNLKSVFNLSKAVLRPMMSKRSGKIVNMSSVVGLIGNAGQTNYAAAKAGILGFTKALAREVASRNICVNAVAPGFIETDMTVTLTDDQRNMLQNQIPLKRLGKPEDIARVICFLCSADADYITGQVLCVDGGMVMS